MKEYTEWSLKISLIDDDYIIYYIVVGDCHDGMFDGESAPVGELSLRIKDMTYDVMWHPFFTNKGKMDKKVRGTIHEVRNFEEATRHIDSVLNP